MSIIIPRRPAAYGQPHLRIARNDGITDGTAFGALRAAANTLAGKRKKVLWSHSTMGATMRVSAAGTNTIWRGYFRTGPNPRAVKVHIIARGSTSAYAASGQRIQWTVGAVAQPAIYIAVDTVGSTPNGLRYYERTFTDGSGNDLAGNTLYEFSVAVTDGAHIIGATIYEMSSDQLDTATHQCVPQDVTAPGAPILDRDILDVTTLLYTLYKQNGTHHVRWTNEDTSPPTRNSATFANVIDGSTAAHATTAAGQWYYPYRRGRQVTTTVPVMFWCYASTNVGTTGQVRFIGSAGTLATISSIGTTAQIYTTTGTINSATTEDLCIIQHADSTPNTITTVAAGFFEYTA